MTSIKGRHNRRSIRLQGYDYAKPGSYFITLCTQNGQCLFGKILGRRMDLSSAGHMVYLVWEELSSRYPGVETDAFVVMPNHVHGIITLVGAGPCACPGISGQPQGVAPTMGLPDVVHHFKTMSTKRYSDGVRQLKWPPYTGKLWQRNYYERVIRNNRELNRVREYIVNNPLQWELDQENPGNMEGFSYRG